MVNAPIRADAGGCMRDASHQCIKKTQPNNVLVWLCLFNALMRRNQTSTLFERCKNPFSTLLFFYVVVALEEQYVKTYVHAYVYVCE